ncbi:MAG: M13 family metallopeptidase [Clostridia bacterium]|nr:M13 family metallopeptidase [Clostridia bacterium]MBQ6123044.1 M13 family metallopeptidase [Clostridia bacterium]
MMKKLTALLLCALLALAPALAEGGAILDGRWLCADVQGNVTEDTPAELKDDFGLFVNKDWILQAEIPAGESKAGSMEDVMRTLKDRQIALLKDDSLTGHDAELVRKLYALVSDWDYRDAQGVEPAMPVVEALKGIDSLEALTEYLYDRNNLKRFYPLTMSVGADFTDPDIYITQIGTPKLLLQDSAEYSERTQAGDLYYALYQQVIAYVLQRLGYSEDEAAQVIENAFAFEALMAAHIKPTATHYQADYFTSLLNYYSPEELAALAGDFPILDMLQAYGLKVGQRFLVTEPDYIAALPEFYTEENVTLMRDWMTLRAALTMNNMLDQETNQQADAISNAVMGVTGETSDDDNALSTVLNLLPVPMDNLYIQAYCTEQQRQDMLDIIADVVAFYRTMLESVDWLSDETREKAIEKLDNLRIRAVYPDTLGDWSDLDFAGIEDGGSLLAANAAVENYLIALQSEKVDTAVDKDKWDQMTMQTAQVNAFYNPQDNSINILAGILSGEVYNEDMSYEQKLGGIGTVIGHEISHAFDTNGSQFDKDGAISNWWTEEDYAAFQARAAKLAAWYDGFIPWEGASYSGQQVQTEAIADMGSVKCLLAIAAQQEDFDYDAFFRQYATVWRMQALPAYLVTLVAQDTHPMRYLRINATLAQFDEFVDFYGIQPGDGMYVAPEDRVAVW